MKDNNKLNEILSGVIVIAVYIILSVAIIVGSKWVYVLILLTAILMLVLLWKERFNILKLWAIIMLIYSMRTLIGWNGEVLIGKSNDNPLVATFILLAELFALHSVKILIWT